MNRRVAIEDVEITVTVRVKGTFVAAAKATRFDPGECEHIEDIRVMLDNPGPMSTGLPDYMNVEAFLSERELDECAQQLIDLAHAENEYDYGARDAAEEREYKRELVPWLPHTR